LLDLNEIGAHRRENIGEIQCIQPITLPRGDAPTKRTRSATRPRIIRARRAHGQSAEIGCTVAARLAGARLNFGTMWHTADTLTWIGSPDLAPASAVRCGSFRRFS